MSDQPVDGHREAPEAPAPPRLDVVCARCNHHADHHQDLEDVLAKGAKPTYGECRWKDCVCHTIAIPSDSSILADTIQHASSRVIMPINISKEAETLLYWLLASGLYGRDLEATAERVICVGLEALLQRPVLEPARRDLHRRQHAKVHR